MSVSPVEEFLWDPTKISNSLRMIQNYFQLDGVVCCADKTILAGGLGCSIDRSNSPPQIKPLPDVPADLETRMAKLLQAGRVETAIEVTRRLNILLPDKILMGVVTGPLTLAKQLTGLSNSHLLHQPDLLDMAAKATLAFSKALGDAGIDLLVVSEETLPPLDEQALKVLNRCYSPIWNTAKFYEIFPLLMVDQFLSETAGPLKKIHDGVVLSADIFSGTWKEFKRISFALPVSLLEKEQREIESFLTKNGVLSALESSRLFLVTTKSEVPRDINKQFMIRGIRTIRDFLKKEGAVLNQVI